jgi:DNA-binding LacI/PurR family transcriptional regulator
LTTITFLASIAGVAPSTVSRALRNDPSIGTKMRLYIQNLAREYHYHPNKLMHGLMTGQSGVIGIVLPQLTISFNASILSAMLNSVMDAGYRSMIFETYSQLDKVKYAIHAMIEQRVDGALLYTGLGEPLPADLILSLRSNSITAVTFDAICEPLQFDTVRTDEEQLASLVIDYLLSLGHRRIVWLNHVTNLRFYAIKSALKKRHLPTQYCLEPPRKSYEDTADIEVIRKLWNMVPRPTALIAGDDIIAANAILSCNKLGISVPEDISIVGCGNLNLSTFTQPQLTTVDQQPSQIGATAMDCLITHMNSSDDQRLLTTHYIPTRLIMRNSCARV